MDASRAVATLTIMAWLLGPRLATLQAEEPGLAGVLTVSGKVVLEDGAPAAGAIVEFRGTDFEPRVDVKTDEQGRYELRAHFGNSAPLYVRSAHGAQQATRLFMGATARTDFARPIDFKLAPAVERTITVTDADGEPVPDAFVVIEGEACRVQAKTAADGTARVLLPANHRLRSVVAWHQKVGGASQDFKQDVTEDAFRLSLLRSTPHVIRIVDVEGRPIRALPFRTSARAAEGEWISTRDIDAAGLVSDDHGEVIVRWFPRDTTYVDVHINHPEWKVDEIEVDKNDHHLTIVHVRHKVRVAGQLKMPAGQSAEGILVHSFGFGPKHRGDGPTARAAADGSFSFLATSDHGYALQIADSHWASDGWTGLILAEENSVPADISMEVYPAIPVEVHVARGPEHTPIAGAWIAARMTGMFTWQNAKGEKKNASSGGHSYWLRTDEQGITRVAAAKGTLEVRLSAGEWGEEKEIKVDGKEPAVVEFYRPWASQRKIVGRLTVNDAPYQQSPTATIMAATNHKQYVPEPLKASLREDGSFELEGDTANLSVLVMDADKRMSAFAHIGPEVMEINLAMVPTAIFSGVLVNHQGEPLANTALRLRIHDINEPGTTEEIETDAAGRFHFDTVAADAIITLQVRRPVRGKPDYAGTRIASFAAGEKREDKTVRVDLRSEEERGQN